MIASKRIPFHNLITVNGNGTDIEPLPVTGFGVLSGRDKIIALVVHRYTSFRVFGIAGQVNAPANDRGKIDNFYGKESGVLFYGESLR